MYESWNNTNSFAICIDLMSRAGCWVLQAPKYMFGKPHTNIISIVMPLSMIVQLSFTFNVACSLDTCLLESNSTAISFKALQVVQKHSGEFSSNFKSLQWKFGEVCFNYPTWAVFGDLQDYQSREFYASEFNNCLKENRRSIYASPGWIYLLKAKPSSGH